MIDKTAYIWVLPHEAFEKMYKMMIYYNTNCDYHSQIN